MTGRAAALDIWHTAVRAVAPRALMASALEQITFPSSGRIVVVGAGKASAGMASALEELRPELVHRITGLVNVPDGPFAPTRCIRLHPARPAASNFPTQAGVDGAEAMLRLLSHAKPPDIAVCLISGGGSALLPLPVPGVNLDDKLHMTRLLHASGASIHQMNAVRKHLSRVKGGRLAEAFSGSRLISLILSDVIGDPLDVIASGPTAPDPTTFADAVAILKRFDIREQVPETVRRHLELGLAGEIPDTPKMLPDTISNIIIGNNATALQASEQRAAELGFHVLNLGSAIDGETRTVAADLAKLVRFIRYTGTPAGLPACVLLGGETTVTLGRNPGLGGRNQEFVLALLQELRDDMTGITILSAGTDGEDGPTDAAGAVADADTITFDLDMADFLNRHDAYHYFELAGGLIRTGLTGTNVTDVRLVLIV